MIGEIITSYSFLPSRKDRILNENVTISSTHFARLQSMKEEKKLEEVATLALSHTSWKRMHSLDPITIQDRDGLFRRHL
jgi:hypothetical protein